MLSMIRILPGLLALAPALVHAQRVNPASKAVLRSTSPAKIDHQATVSAAVDGSMKTDWIGGSPNTWYGFIEYPSLTFTWDTPQEMNTITLHDRATLTEHAGAAVIEFDDGQKVHANAIPNDGRPHTIVFGKRRVRSLTLSIVDGVGENIGLSEVAISRDPFARPISARKRSYGDYVSYVDPPSKPHGGAGSTAPPPAVPSALCLGRPTPATRIKAAVVTTSTPLNFWASRTSTAGSCPGST